MIFVSRAHINICYRLEQSIQMYMRWCVFSRKSRRCVFWWCVPCISHSCMISTVFMWSLNSSPQPMRPHKFLSTRLSTVRSNIYSAWFFTFFTLQFTYYIKIKFFAFRTYPTLKLSLKSPRSKTFSCCTPTHSINRLGLSSSSKCMSINWIFGVHSLISLRFQLISNDFFLFYRLFQVEWSLRSWVCAFGCNSTQAK